MRALGIDVGVRKGLDLVLLDGSLSILETRRGVRAEDLGDAIDRAAPDIVAVDAPPRWGTAPGRSRRTERELRRFGIQSYGTPSDPERGEHPFFRWMTVGFEVYRVAAEHGFAAFGGGSPRGTAIEVFPHASAVVLAGCLPPREAGRRAWRAGVLRGVGLDVVGLRGADQVDAALAAYTGLMALRRRCFAPGDPKEGVIVLPSTALPARPYRRCTQRRPDPVDVPLPGLARCGCGDPACDRLTSGEFARGHDSRRKSMLWKLAREGQEAADELRRRGWELPPETR